MQALAKQHAEVMTLPPAEALEQILASPQPRALVHALPVQDLHYLIQENSLDDALPLIALASSRQWTYLTDMDAWDGDRINFASLTRSLAVYLRADPVHFVRWAIQEQPALLELYLFNNLEVKAREHDQDPSELGPEFITLDDSYYFRIRNEPTVTERQAADDPSADAAPDMTEEIKLANEARRQYMQILLKTLADNDYGIYQQMLLRAASVLPAESEEELLRLRNVRLAEKGLLPFHEAIGVYQPVRPDQIKPRLALKAEHPHAARSLAARIPLQVMDDGNPVQQALALLENDGILEEVESEFVTLCNRIIVADGRKASRREALGAVVRKVCSYIHIGLQRLDTATLSERQTHLTARAATDAATMRRHTLTDIFRVGWDAVMRLKWRVQEWLDQSWFRREGLTLMVWDRQWAGILGGLLLKRPQRYDPDHKTICYRDFDALEEIEAAAAQVENVMAMDRLLGALDLALPALGDSDHPLTYKNLMLTAWVHECLMGVAPNTHAPDGQSPELKALPLSALQTFLATFFVPSEDQDVQARTIAPGQREAFLAWLSRRSKLPPEQISDSAGSVLETLFRELEDEYGSVAPADLDARFIHLFIVT
jgi:hypothetical protein